MDFRGCLARHDLKFYVSYYTNYGYRTLVGEKLSYKPWFQNQLCQTVHNFKVEKKSKKPQDFFIFKKESAKTANHSLKFF